jgi:hypothetical protein
MHDGSYQFRASNGIKIPKRGNPPFLGKRTRHAASPVRPERNSQECERIRFRLGFAISVKRFVSRYFG